MRFFYLTGLIIMFASCAAAKKLTSKPTLNQNFSFANNVVIAHRGAWKKNNFPQNSIASLKQAIKLKFAGSEFDVRMTADDSLVINHDPKYNGLEVEKTNFATLEGYKLSNGENLPTLGEYLAAGTKDNHSTRLICEIKPSGISKERGLEVSGKIVKLVHQFTC